MKWLGLALPFLLGIGGRGSSKPHRSLKESALEIFDAITARSRTPVFLYLAGLASIAFVCGGTFMFLIEATKQYDSIGFLAWNSTLITSLLLTTFAVGGLSFVYYRAWPGVRGNAVRRHEAEIEFKRQQELQAGSLEFALSALVLDFVKERELKRQQRTSATEAEQASSPFGDTPETTEREPRQEEERPSSYH